MDNDETIFVGIPSYRDSECQHTIADLLKKASNPEKVHVGVCFQCDGEEDKHCFESWPQEIFPGQIQITRVPYQDATGPCYARYLTQQLFKSQKYYFSIDSHMRFIPSWDKVLIELLSICPSEKSIITSYPPGYELPNKLDENVKPIVTCAKELGKDGMIRFVGKELNYQPSAPVPAFFWVSGFSFSRSTMVQEVPYDPHLPFLFFGEESSMTVRLWTHGWDFYAPGMTILYHLWKRTHRPNFRENPDQSEFERKSQNRIKFLLNIIDDSKINENDKKEIFFEIEKYGLGNKRTLEEYQEISGVDFKNQIIHEKAKNGGLGKEVFMDDILNKIMLLAQNLK